MPFKIIDPGPKPDFDEYIDQPMEWVEVFRAWDAAACAAAIANRDAADRYYGTGPAGSD